FVLLARAARSLLKTKAVNGSGIDRTARRGTTMDIIAAAALIAGGIVVAAVVYGRLHGAGPATATSPTASTTAIAAELPERAAALARREEALAQRESELERERGGVADSRQVLTRELEVISGLSASRA